MMKSASHDLKFFTNEADATLYDRFVSTLQHAQFFDVLVGYFRTSGFKRLADVLEHTEKVRILVGINIDRRAYDGWQHAMATSSTQQHPQGSFDFQAHDTTRQAFLNNLQHEMATSEDSLIVEQATHQFLAFLRAGKLELRAYPLANIHAKVYILRFPENFMEYGKVITGSSNFSENGLVAQREFNVELKDRPDVDYALEKFEALWAEGVDLSEAYVDTITRKTWLSDSITPYQIYLKFLYEYFKEDINLDAEALYSLPAGFLDLAYQRQAVLAAKKILDGYDGVFLADVVGLGKTFISALLLQQLPGQKLIICPPVLENYWRDTLRDFFVPGCEVVSLGKLEHILNRGTDRYGLVLIDEAHRFRNELTQRYEQLALICQNKKVVLVSATPLNNSLDDLLSLLKLFQPAKRSDIPGVSNLEAFFSELKREIDQHDKDSPERLEAIRDTAALARDKVLKHVMVRRTRSEIKNYFSEDLAEQGLTFPEIAEPQRMIYTFEGDVEQLFNDTIELLKQFRYARYTPLLYQKKGASSFEQLSQRNVGGFMKGILVKRLESSFYAFRETLKRFIGSYQRFIAMLEQGVVWISNDVDVFDLLDDGDIDRLEQLREEGRAERYAADNFKPALGQDLRQDLILLTSLEGMWRKLPTDPKLEHVIGRLKQDSLLQNKVIIFSEAADTVSYLQEQLEQHFPKQVMAFTGAGGRWRGQNYGKASARELIVSHFDPSYSTEQVASDDIRLLVTSDVLAEGINLHRANVVINYDLPWNPTRVLQRVGRVNRVGTQHDTVYVYNIFPTSQSDAHLGLEGNIISKIQTFHNTLGEDAKYLSEEEEVSTHELFGDQLYRRLNDKATFDEDGTEEDESELKYLQVIRHVRDHDPDMFEHIKRLPKKARSVQADAHTALLTFFRRGKLKRFVHVLADAQEVTFLQAAKQFACAPDTPRATLNPHASEHYYEALARAKAHLAESEQEDPMAGSKRGGSNDQKLLKAIKASRKYRGFTDEDEAFLRRVRQALEAGIIPKNRIKSIVGELNQHLDPRKLLALLRRYLDDASLTPPEREQDSRPVEVILSSYFSHNVTNHNVTND